MFRIIQSRIFRCIFCLLLICCLLVNISPIRVKATAAAATAVVGTVAIGFAVAACMQALGVRAGTDASTFTSLINACSNALSPSWAVDGFVTMLAVTSGTVTKTYASQNFLQAILDWLFDSNTLSSQFSTSQTLTYYGTEYNFTSDYPFIALRWNFNYLGFYMLASLYPCKISYGDGKTISLTTNANQPEDSIYYRNGFYISAGCSESVDASSFAGFRYLGDFTSLPYFETHSNNYSYSYVCTNYLPDLLCAVSNSDLTLESVGRDVDTDYKTYVDTGIVSVDFGITFEDDPNTDPDESENNDKPWVPTTIPSLNPGYDDQTPDDARTGLTPDDVLDEIISDPSDSGSGSDPGTGTGGSSSGGSGSWAPSSFDGFALDLSKYFPFCIPFDLYDFFTCLNADPVAPVIEWAIPMPGGDTYPLEIDLSPFDPVAQLLRRLELLLFCVGLAFKTRDLIKG